jgi:hypothetical protein
MRRVIIEEPYSKAALLSQHLAVFSLAVAVVGVWRVDRGLDLLVVLGGSLIIACAAILTAILAFVVIWRSGRRGAGQAFTALLLAAPLVGYPAYLAQHTIGLPRLPDISTDLADPPGFSLSRAALAARGGSTPPRIAVVRREAQLKAFPQVQPLLLDLDAQDAFDATVKAVKAAGWKIVELRRPGGRSDLGHIDAIATSLILGFPSDITLRLRPIADQTRIDIRSVSRFAVYGYDFGANSRNIANLEAALEAVVDQK